MESIYTHGGFVKNWSNLGHGMPGVDSDNEYDPHNMDVICMVQKWLANFNRSCFDEMLSVSRRFYLRGLIRIHNWIYI